MKYSASLVLFAFCVVLLLAWNMPARINQDAGMVPGMPNLPGISRELSEFPIPHAAVSEAQQQLFSLHTINWPEDRRISALIELRPEVPARVLSVRAEPEPVEQVLPAAPPAYRQRDYKLSMVYVSADARYAVIDGVFRQEGDFMPDGAEVFQIREHAVELRAQDMVQVLKINR